MDNPTLYFFILYLVKRIDNQRRALDQAHNLYRVMKGNLKEANREIRRLREALQSR